MVSGTIEPMGTMLAGQAADAFYASIAHRNLLSIGLNCATGPEFMTDHIRTIHRDGPDSHLLLSERRAPERGAEVPGDSRVVCRPAREVRRPRLAESGRRLLRHDAGAHQGNRGDGGRQAAESHP